MPDYWSYPLNRYPFFLYVSPGVYPDPKSDRCIFTKRSELYDHKYPLPSETRNNFINKENTILLSRKYAKYIWFHMLRLCWIIGQCVSTPLPAPLGYIESYFSVGHPRPWHVLKCTASGQYSNNKVIQL